MTGLSKNNKIWYLPVAIVVFLLFSCLYFYPLLQGKILFQSDTVNWVGTSKETVDHYNITGEPALWTNSMFGGMPTYQIALQADGNIFEQINKAIGLYLPRPANYMFIALLAFFLFLRSLRVNYFMSIAGAMCYSLGTYLITFMEVGHNTKVDALALMPLVFTGIQYLMQRKYFLGGSVTLFAMTLEITANHPQINYYMFLLIGIWMLSEFYFAVREKKLRTFFVPVGILVATVLFAVSANTSKLWTTYEYSKESIRGGAILTKASTESGDKGLDKDYAFSWSSGVAESFSIMYPNFAGGGSGKSFAFNNKGETVEGPVVEHLRGLSQREPQKMQELMQVSHSATKYWGDMPFTSGPIYVGTILCFLFILGMFVLDNRFRWWMLAGTILSLFLGWGNNFPAFNYFMFDHFPLYNKFRTVSMAMTILCFTIPVVAYVVTDRFLSADLIEDKKKMDGLKWASIIVGGLSVILWLAPGMFHLLSPSETAYLNASNDAETTAYFNVLKDARVAMIKADVLRSLFFVALAAGALFLYLHKTISRGIAIAVICLLPVIDLLMVDSQYLSEDNYVADNYFEQYFAQKVPMIKDNDPNFRVVNTTVNFDQDGNTSYFYKSLGGYHGAKLQRYQDIIEGYLSKGNMAVINMLNAKYAIVSNGKQMQVQRNPLALGNAWYVDSVKYASTADEEFADIADLDPATTVIVPEEFKSQIATDQILVDSSRTIALTSYDPNTISYHSKNAQAGPAVFSEVWYRGNKDWKAYIDGNYVDHFRANYVLRGLWIPAGEHDITFTFEPHSFYAGRNISRICSWLILILSIAGGFLAARNAGVFNNKKKELPIED